MPSAPLFAEHCVLEVTGWGKETEPLVISGLAFKTQGNGNGQNVHGPPLDRLQSTSSQSLEPSEAGVSILVQSWKPRLREGD